MLLSYTEQSLLAQFLLGNEFQYIFKNYKGPQFEMEQNFPQQTAKSRSMDGMSECKFCVTPVMSCLNLQLGCSSFTFCCSVLQALPIGLSQE